MKNPRSLALLVAACGLMVTTGAAAFEPHLAKTDANREFMDNVRDIAEDQREARKDAKKKRKEEKKAARQERQRQAQQMRDGTTRGSGSGTAMDRVGVGNHAPTEGGDQRELGNRMRAKQAPAREQAEAVLAEEQQRSAETEQAEAARKRDQAIQDALEHQPPERRDRDRDATPPRA